MVPIIKSKLVFFSELLLMTHDMSYGIACRSKLVFFFEFLLMKHDVSYGKACRTKLFFSEILAMKRDVLFRWCWNQLWFFRIIVQFGSCISAVRKFKDKCAVRAIVPGEVRVAHLNLQLRFWVQFAADRILYTTIFDTAIFISAP